MDFLVPLLIILLCIVVIPYAIGAIVQIAVWIFMICAIVSGIMIGGAIALIYAITHPKEIYKRYRY